MISYNQKTKKEGKECAVSVIITQLFQSEKTNDRLRISLGISIEPENVGTKESNFKFDLNYLKRKKSNKAIALVKRINDFDRNINLTNQYFQVEKRIPTKEEFKLKLFELLVQDGLIEGKRMHELESKPDHEIYFDSMIANYINSCIEMNKRSEGFKAPSTIAKYMVNFKHFIHYQISQKKRYKMDEVTNEMLLDIVESVNLRTKWGSNVVKYSDIEIKNYAQAIDVDYFNKVPKKRTRNPEGMSQNSARNILSNLKTFVKQAQKKGYMLGVNLNDEHLHIKATANAKSDVYYTEKFLEAIFQHEPSNEKTALARKYIILASSTGMRYNSISKLYNEKPKVITDEVGNDIMVVDNKSSKTGHELYSPLFKGAREVYETNMAFPEFPDLVLLNSYIRELFVEMEIDEEIDYNEHIYGLGTITTRKKLSDVASSHDNRSSFITNLNELMVDPLLIKRMTHEEIYERSSHQIYVKRKKEDLARQFYKHTKDLQSEIYQY